MSRVLLSCFLSVALLGCNEPQDPNDHAHPHDHPSTPHHGVVASFASKDGKSSGFLELKLHDDKGDLELWLARDQAMSQPFDLPLANRLQVKFIDVGGKLAELAVRNTETNEDEFGLANIRDSRTNYFIYPTKAESDASWLQGETFQSMVELSWTADGVAYRSESFLLKPHSHASHDHDHDSPADGR